MLFRSNDALIFLGDRRHALVHEFLHALASIGFRCKNVSLGIGRDTVHGIKLPGLAPAVAEAGQDFQRITQEDVDFFVRTIGQKNVFLLDLWKTQYPTPSRRPEFSWR